MSLLAWRRDPHAGRRAVVLLHGWAEDSGLWEATGLRAALQTDPDIAVLACDLPGHGESVEIEVPRDADPAAWAADAALHDLSGFGVAAFSIVAHAEGGMVAAHLAAAKGSPAERMALIGCDDRGRPAQAAEAAEALRDGRARLWSPEASELVARARAGRGHDPLALATWLEHATWPSAARLGSLRQPVLVAVGTADPLRSRAPRLAALFHDGHLATAEGSGQEMLSAPGLHAALASFLSRGRR